MTGIPSQSSPPRDRALRRGVNALIPQAESGAVPAAEQAAAALAALETVSVQAGLLHAAVVLLEERAQVSEDEGERAAAGTTAALLRGALDGRDRPAPSS
ncbi:hypothetical protein ACIQU6_04860 [Streptomyces sp. NPDC090442]|uniref:hypothetical protein n=1 Tax=Streptomyces sp. NPDC090442 TaxID=3365962 RepID=UPI0037FDB8CC